ncbi:OsmC family peroxiredoxin, partial [Klebsiella pneumoniae]|nr:OsmC family peroxiredoxin [Klebsiella pneumoniae]MCL3342621.1 OsmC family peroxiredoxin [Klebsiella pneumoniae]
MAIHKKGLAHWEGDLKHGKGTVSTESGALSQQPYGFNTRFEGVKGTNPEELIGAAHAACFSMALSLMLSEEGYTATSIDTMLWSSFFGHADQMVGLCTGGQLGGRAGQRFVL